jgi:hypothetical protein
MDRHADPQTLKQQALLALDQSRASLSGGLAQARERWSPRHLIHNSMEKHPVVLIGIGVSAALAGFLMVRWMFTARENSRDTFSKPARKRTLGSFLLNGLWGLGRGPLKALAVQQLAPLIVRFLSELKSPPQPPPSE